MRRIIRDRRTDAAAELAEARELLEEGIRKGEFYAGGYDVKPQGSTAKQMLVSLLGNSVASIYPKLDCIDTNYHTDAEILEILRGQRQALEGTQPNERAIAEMQRYLENQHNLGLDTPMSEVQKHFQEKPFGWREVDVAAVAAELLAAGNARLRYAGATVDITTPTAVGRLRKASETKQTLIMLRVQVPDHVRRVARDVVMQVTGKRGLPLEEADLAAASHQALAQRRTQLEDLLKTEYRPGTTYPGRDDLEHGIKAIASVLAAGRDASDLLPRIVSQQDDLEDAAEDLEDVLRFFPDQQRIWDKAVRLRRAMEREREYLEADRDACEALDTITGVLDQSAPYKQIRLLSDAMQTVSTAHGAKLEAKQRELLDLVEQIYADIEAKASASNVSLAEIGQRKLSRRDAVHKSESLRDLDALAVQLSNDQTTFYARIDEEVQKRKRPPKPATPPHGGTAPDAPTPKPEHIKPVERSLVFKPETLRSEQDVDRYLTAVRTKLLSSLDGADGIRIQ